MWLKKKSQLLFSFYSIEKKQASIGFTAWGEKRSVTKLSSLCLSQAFQQRLWYHWEPPEESSSAGRLSKQHQRLHQTQTCSQAMRQPMKQREPESEDADGDIHDKYNCIERVLTFIQLCGTFASYLDRWWKQIYACCYFYNLFCWMTGYRPRSCVWRTIFIFDEKKKVCCAFKNTAQENTFCANRPGNQREQQCCIKDKQIWYSCTVYICLWVYKSMYKHICFTLHEVWVNKKKKKNYFFYY